MSPEVLISAAVLAAALLPLLLAAYRTRARPLLAAALLIALVAPVAFVWQVRSVRPALFATGTPPVTDRPIQVEMDGYVSSRTCAACHPHHYATWHASYHRTMTQVATPDTVVADFDDVVLERGGRTYRLTRDEKQLWVEIDDPDGEGRVSRRLVMSTGSHHFQAFWMPTGDSRRMEIFPFCYRIDLRRWVSIEGTFLAPPMERSFPPGTSWNLICNRCHATRGRPGIDESGRMDTTVAEFGIACEACHGPAEEHVRVNRDPLRRYRLHFSGEPDPTIVHPLRLPPDRASQVCGQCHGASDFIRASDAREWYRTGSRYRPGDDLLSLKKMLVSDPTRFWSDGMIRVGGREYNSLLETPCYKHGDPAKGIMTCFSCHTMHKPPDDPRPIEEWANDQLTLGMDGNEACLKCHTGFRSRIEEHTHHARGSTGSRCMNCHMPYTAYGLLKATRSHQINNPTVQASLLTGRPNACNQCHLDKTLAWTAESLNRWYGTPVPEMGEDERTVAASVLWLLKGDAGQRALAAWTMGWKPAQEASGKHWQGWFLSQLLEDPYGAVRAVAHRSLRSLPGLGDFEYDYVGPPSEWRAARSRARSLWTRTVRDAGKTQRLEDLLDMPEPLSEQQRLLLFHRLLKERDDRPVFLEE